MENCHVDEHAVLLRTDDIRPFRHHASNWLWGSYTAVYLGVGVAAYEAVKAVMHNRQPRGFNQSLAHHPDVRRKIAEMSVELEAARLMTYHSAWLSDQQGPTPETLAALFRAKYVVGEAVSRITRAALSLGGAHALFKTSPLERLFRDGAIAPMQFPPSDFCLSTIGILELGLDTEDLLPPLKRA
jgi:alkylation response protein AidB-like acyl-CoA dehydrogenase